MKPLDLIIAGAFVLASLEAIRRGRYVMALSFVGMSVMFIGASIELGMHGRTTDIIAWVFTIAGFATAVGCGLYVLGRSLVRGHQSLT